MLPPNFEQKDPHIYGTLTLIVSSLDLLHQSISSVEPHFFGRGKSQIKSFDRSPSIIFQYSIATNLWHFYSYLTDCRIISLILTTRDNKVYTSQVPIHLLQSGQVLNRFNPSINYLFQGNSYLLSKKEKIGVFDRNHKMLGNLQVQLNIEFDKDIHQVIYDNNLINFEDILVIDEISPIPSSVDFQQSVLEPEEKQAEFVPSHKLNILESEINLLRETHKQLQLPQVNKEETEILEDEKRMEDDIDRLIAEMQNKPYDSSRYLQGNNEGDHITKENQNFQNYSINRLSSEKKSSCQRLPPKPPGSIKTNSSPIRSFQPILSYTVATPQDFTNRTNYLMNNSNTLNQSQRSYKSNSRQRLTRPTESKNGLIKLKVHELTMQRSESQLSLLLKVYLNDESTEYYSANSFKQGEALTFNSSIKIQDKTNIEQLRFQLIDAFDLKTFYAQGIFDMSRLYDQNPSKGIFMVNMVSPQVRSDSTSKVIKVAEQQLTRVTPNVKSLRIELEYEDPIEIVQVYFCLSDFSQVCKVCRYKIPMTKQTIQFRVSDLSKNKHVNIFPHNRSSSSGSSQIITVELWAEKDLIGFSEVSLKPLYNTNKKMINCSLDPISLFNEIRQVNDLKGTKTKASFKLDLSYGTISQVQSLLNHHPKRQTRTQIPKKEVEVESHLGIYLKENKMKKQVEVQVDNEIFEQKPIQSLSRKNTMSLLQQQQLPDDEDDVFEGEVSMKTEENEFLNKTIQQKYLNKETVSIFNKQDSNPKENCLNNTMKSKNNGWTSLTKNFQELIKNCLSCFANQKQFQKLKDQCQQHLLYNFIDRQVLADILEGLGLQSSKIDIILSEIISHSNQMTNINMLYDLICGLLLEGQIKEKYLDDCQMGRYCFSCFVKNAKEQEQNTFEEVQFDEDLDFDESKKIFQKVGFRLTMRQFNQMEKYLHKVKQQHPKIKWSQIKENLLKKEFQKTDKEEKNKEYEKVIEAQLYNNYEWDDQDDYFISNINQPQKNISEISSTEGYHYKDNDQSLEHKKSQEFSNNYQHFSDERKNLKEKKSAKSQLIQTVSPNHKLIIEGFENCIEATQCHLNILLTSPQLRVTYKGLKNNSQVCLRRDETKKLQEIEVLLSEDEGYLDGCIQLLSSSKVVAKCNFSIIKDVRSIYTIKSIPEAQFCGLIYLLFSEK